MTTQGPLTDAEETWVNSAHPARSYGSGAWMRVGGATRAALVTFPIKTILGRTVTEAPLNLHIGPGHVGQTYTIKRITSDWSADDVDWNTKPTVGSTSVTVTVSAQADGTVVTADIYSLLQEVADGATWRGVQITSDAASEQLLYARESGQPASDLTIELSDSPEIPEGLFPDVGAIGAAKVPLGWRAADLDGFTGQADYRIQYSTTDNGASPDADTGWLPGSLPRHDMTAYAYGFTDGTPTGWRVNVRDAAGNESGWSDWAHVTYDSTLGTLVLDSPASTTFGDPSLRVQAHLVGEDIETFRIRVAKSTDQTDIVYNSRVQAAAGGLLDFQLPFRDPKSGRRLFPDDQPRWLNVRVWGAKSRATGQGQSDYVETWVLVTADDDLGVAAPTGLTVTPVAGGDPRAVWEWSCATLPDGGWLLMNGGEVLARLDPDEPTAASGTYTFADDGILQPWQVNECVVRAVDGGARSAPSNTVSLTTKPEGRWIITDDPDIGIIVLAEGGSDSIQSVDTASVATKLNGEEYAVTYGPPRIGGTFTGAVETIEDYRKLEALRQRPDLRPRFIWATRSIKGRLSNLSPMPDPDRFLPNHPTHLVSLGISQVED